jgi:peroxiredoxin
MNKSILKFITLASLLVLLLAACSRKPAAEEAVPIPPVGDFKMPNLASEFPGEIRTGKYAGKVQLVLFFRADDPACRGAIAGWNGLQKDLSGRGFTIIGAIVDDRPDDVLAREVATLGAEWPVGHAADAVVTAFGGPGAIRAIPTAFLLDRDGHLARAYPGHVQLAVLRDDITRLLDGQPLPGTDAPPGAAP